MTLRKLRLAKAKAAHEIRVWQHRHTSAAAALKRRERSDRRWQGCRRYTNQVQDLAEVHRPHAAVTSRKRTSLGNAASDHNLTNRDADAIDLAPMEGDPVKGDQAFLRLVVRELGGPAGTGDYGTWTTQHPGGTAVFRHQVIAQLHGTGPHFHYGCKRVS